MQIPAPYCATAAASCAGVCTVTAMLRTACTGVGTPPHSVDPATVTVNETVPAPVAVTLNTNVVAPPAASDAKFAGTGPRIGPTSLDTSAPWYWLSASVFTITSAPSFSAVSIP